MLDMWEEKGINPFQSPRPVVVVKCVENWGFVMCLETPSARVKKRTLVKAIKESGRSYNLHLGYTDLKTGDKMAQHLWLQLPGNCCLYFSWSGWSQNKAHNTHTHTVWQNWESAMRTLFITFAEMHFNSSISKGCFKCQIRICLLKMRPRLNYFQDTGLPVAK